MKKSKQGKELTPKEQVELKRLTEIRNRWRDEVENCNVVYNDKLRQYRLHWLPELEAKIFGNKLPLNALLDDLLNWDFAVENEPQFILDKSSVSRAFCSS